MCRWVRELGQVSAVLRRIQMRNEFSRSFRRETRSVDVKGGWRTSAMPSLQIVFLFIDFDIMNYQILTISISFTICGTRFSWKKFIYI
jgi:hypothetical protein